MPDNQWIQYGSFGILAFLIVGFAVWFVRAGYPMFLQTIRDAGATLSTSIERGFSNMERVMAVDIQERRDSDRRRDEKIGKMLVILSDAYPESRLKADTIFGMNTGEKDGKL